MKIKIYQVGINSTLKELNPNTLYIQGRLIDYIQEPDYSNPEFPNDGFHENALYSYTKDNLFRTKFPSLKLNYQIIIHRESEFDDQHIANLSGYTHLNFFQRVKIGWIFGKNWFQNKENIRWLITIPVSILTAYVTTMLTK